MFSFFLNYVPQKKYLKIPYNYIAMENKLNCKHILNKYISISQDRHYPANPKIHTLHTYKP